MSKRGAYLIIDTETTGFDPLHNGLIQFACAVLDDRLDIVATLELDVCPQEGCVINEESLAVNGFTRERMEKGVECEAFVRRFREFIGVHFDGKPILIGQFYPFDYAFLCSAFSRYAPEAFYGDNIFGNNFIDTKSIVNERNLAAKLRGEPVPFPVTSLSAPGGLKDTLGVAKDYESHTALGDVLATRDVLIELLKGTGRG